MSTLCPHRTDSMLTPCRLQVDFMKTSCQRRVYLVWLRNPRIVLEIFQSDYGSDNLLVRMLRYCKIFPPVSIEHLETYLNAWLFVYNLQQTGTHPDTIVDEVLSSFVWVKWLCLSNRIFSDVMTWKSISLRLHCEYLNFSESPHLDDMREKTENFPKEKIMCSRHEVVIKIYVILMSSKKKTKIDINW